MKSNKQRHRYIKNELEKFKNDYTTLIILTYYNSFLLIKAKDDKKPISFIDCFLTFIERFMEKPEHTFKLTSQFKLALWSYIRLYCHYLPFKDWNDPNQTYCKFEFLSKIVPEGNNIINSKLSPEKTKEAWNKFLLRGAVESPVNDLEWIGNISEIKLELASIFFYEYYKHNIKAFDDVFISPLARIIGNTEAICRTRYSVYKYHLETNKLSVLTPKKAHEYLKEMVEKFPLNIEFLKWFWNSKSQNRFLDLHLGNDEETQRVRISGQIYSAYADYVNSKEKKPNKLISILERATTQKQFFIPDSYIWCLLMHIHQETNSSFNDIDSVFHLGQKQLPWSKPFLLESVRNRLSSDNDFLQTIENIINETGLQLYTTVHEVQFHLYDTPAERMEMELEEHDEDDQIEEKIPIKSE